MPSCSWCNAKIPRTTSAPSAEGHDHVCVLCAAFLRSGQLLPLRDYMHGVDSPILFVDSAGVVIGGNRAAEQTLGRRSSELEGLRGGDVIACAYATLPGGCGSTVYCEACPIRTKVMHTNDTGQGLDRVPAVRPIRSDIAIIQTQFLLTTRLVRQAVMLRIDDMSPVERVPAVAEGTDLTA